MTVYDRAVLDASSSLGCPSSGSSSRGFHVMVAPVEEAHLCAILAGFVDVDHCQLVVIMCVGADQRELVVIMSVSAGQWQLVVIMSVSAGQWQLVVITWQCCVVAMK